MAARRSAQALDGYPGPEPADLTSAYACQDLAIAEWRDEIAGWKIGLIAPELRPRFGQERLTGPIFRRLVQTSIPGQVVSVPVFSGGFAAVEAEFVVRAGRDAPANKTEWSLDEAAELADLAFVGVEMAGSPMAMINALGPAVVASDFGNNAGLILGPPVSEWRTDLNGLTCETFIDGRSVGRGGAASIPGGPLEAFRFLLEHCARRGRPLRQGQLASTGAATGIHDIVAGQTARVAFSNGVEILIEAKQAAA